VTTTNSLGQYETLNVNNEVEVNFDILKWDLNDFMSSRNGSYSLAIYQDYLRDPLMDDLFFIPCFGPQPIRNQSLAILTEQLRNRWIEAYPNSKSSVKS
jgi:hypothetical protein